DGADGQLRREELQHGSEDPALALDGARRTAGRFPVEVELGHALQWQFAHLLRLRLEILLFMLLLGQKFQLVREGFGGIGGFGGLLMLFAAAITPAEPDERRVGAPAQTARQLGAFATFHDGCVFPRGARAVKRGPRAHHSKTPLEASERSAAGYRRVHGRSAVFPGVREPKVTTDCYHWPFFQEVRR